MLEVLLQQSFRHFSLEATSIDYLHLHPKDFGQNVYPHHSDSREIDKVEQQSWYYQFVITLQRVEV
jgi:hypothetical protein